MAITQSRTQVNAKASGAEPMSQTVVPTDVVPGQSREDIGGPTIYNYDSRNDSAKIENKGTSQSHTEVNSKGGKADPAKKYVTPSDAEPGGSSSGSYNGTEPSNSATSGNKGPTKLKGDVAYGTHVEVDNKANDTLDELAHAQGASDDFKSKAKVIFESALNQKLQLEISRLEEEFSKRFEEEISDIAEKVEAFLNYTSQQWLEENKLVVENGIRNELSESFMAGMKTLFEDHYVTLPDEKYDIFESMVAKLDDMEDKLNEQIETNVALNSRMSGFQRSATLADVSWDLSEAAKEKLAGLAESVEFESEENYKQKLNILKESFITDGQEAEASSGEYLQESADALAPTVEEEIGGSMAAYSRALSRTISK